MNVGARVFTCTWALWMCICACWVLVWLYRSHFAQTACSVTYIVHNKFFICFGGGVWRTHKFSWLCFGLGVYWSCFWYAIIITNFMEEIIFYCSIYMLYACVQTMCLWWGFVLCTICLGCVCVCRSPGSRHQTVSARIEIWICILCPLRKLSFVIQ